MAVPCLVLTTRLSEFIILFVYYAHRKNSPSLFRIRSPKMRPPHISHMCYYWYIWLGNNDAFCLCKKPGNLHPRQALNRSSAQIKTTYCAAHCEQQPCHLIVVVLLSCSLPQPLCRGRNPLSYMSHGPASTRYVKTNANLH